MLLGFFIWNYPAGLVFLGDGGAYFLGFYVAELGIVLQLHRNPAGLADVSPCWSCIYPVFETLFSMYRRSVLRDQCRPGVPDGIHLHSLIYRRLMRWALGSKDAAVLTRRNCADGALPVGSVQFVGGARHDLVGRHGHVRRSSSAFSLPCYVVAVLAHRALSHAALDGAEFAQRFAA